MNKIYALTLIKNEEKRYLNDWLKNCKLLFDDHIFLDNGSTDNTLKIISKYSKKIIYDASDFAINEQHLRTKLWNEVRKYADEDDWICILDADEFIDNKQFISLREELLNMDKTICGIFCNLLDMWNTNQYRIDGCWSPSKFPLLFRYKDNELYNKITKKLHKSRTPEYVDTTKFISSHINIYHNSLISDDEKLYKYNFYKKNVDINDTNYNHALSILNSETKLANVYENNFSETVLVCSLIHNREWMLENFLEKLINIDYPSKNIYFYFIVNNSTKETIEIITKIRKKMELKNILFEIDFYDFENTDLERKWSNNLIYHMAEMRTMCLKKSKQLGIDYIFSVDSDILVPKYLLKQLIYRQLPVISPIFFATWNVSKYFNFPQVWQNNILDISKNSFFRSASKYYEVGFLGAITLIDIRKIGEIDYHSWPNNQLFGEDRAFCTKLSLNNIKMYADCSFDIMHMDSIKDFKKYKKRGYIYETKNELILYDYDFKRRNRFGTSNKFFIIIIFIDMLNKKIFKYYIINPIQKIKKIVRSLWRYLF